MAPFFIFIALNNFKVYEMEKKIFIAKTISTVFSPPALVTVYLALLIMALGVYNKISLLAEVFFYFYFLPGLPLIYYHRKGIDINYVSGRKRVPYLFFTFLGYAGAYLHFYTEGVSILLGFSALMVLFTFFFMIGSFFSKPSIHVGALVAGIFYLALLYNLKLLVLLAIAPIVAWSRIILRAHTPRQTVYGFILGALSGILGAVVPMTIIIRRIVLQSY